MRTLVVSDLHLGGRTGVDVLRRDDVLAALVAEIARADRLVLLGDVLELRHGPAREALAASEAVLRAFGDALPAGAPCVIVPGNHDHALVTPWLDTLTRPLGLARTVRPATASPLARHVAEYLGADRTTISYPGFWIRDDVFAFHGHYLDPHGTVPTFERISAGAMLRLAGGLPDTGAVAEDYERVLAPLYAWMHSAAQRAGDEGMAAGAGRAGRTYTMLQGDGHQAIRLRLLTTVFPLGIRGLNLLGLGPLSSDISVDSLRVNAIAAVSEALRRLDVQADHVLFGHSHRAGPFPEDDLTEWRTPEGAWLYNTGTWVREHPALSGTGPDNPYWPGSVVVVEGDGAPRLRRLLKAFDT